VLPQGYCQVQLARIDLQELLGIGKSCILALLKTHRKDPEGFTIAYRRSAPAEAYPEAEDAIETALLRLDCHKPCLRRRVHDRGVLTASIGAPIQHDASIHLWCPQAGESWLQDLLVHTCTCENLSTKEEARSALRDELHRYNNQ
jgi:hypothetical protein